MNVTIAVQTWPWISFTYSSVRCVWSLLSLLGNSLTISIIYRNKDLRTSSNYLVASLAVADLLGGLSGILNPLLLHYNNTSSSGAWLALCCVHEKLFYISASLNVSTICFIAVDRFIYIHNPLKYHSLITERRIIVNLIVFWSYFIVLVTFIITYSHQALAELKYCSIALAVPGCILGQ